MTVHIANADNLTAALNANLAAYGLPPVSGVRTRAATVAATPADRLLCRLTLAAVQDAVGAALGMAVVVLKPASVSGGLVFLALRIPLAPADFGSAAQARLRAGLAAAAAVNASQVVAVGCACIAYRVVLLTGALISGASQAEVVAAAAKLDRLTSTSNLSNQLTWTCRLLTSTSNPSSQLTWTCRLITPSPSTSPLLDWPPSATAMALLHLLYTCLTPALQ
jgi:hypothetical protein